MKCSDTKYNGSPWEWRTLGVAVSGSGGPGSGRPWEWLILGVADPGSGGPWEWRTLTATTGNRCKIGLSCFTATLVSTKNMNSGNTVETYHACEIAY